MATPDRPALDVDLLNSAVSGTEWRHVEVVEETGSTNADLTSRAAAGEDIGGAVLVETVFGLPGMGRTAFDAIFERDASLLLGVMFFSSLCVVLVSLVIDLLYVALDPRVELK